MNKSLKKVDIEDVLFFDAEMVRLLEKLDVDSRQFENYQKKTRNMETDELLPAEEVQAIYDKRAALLMTYNKVVTVGVGYVRTNEDGTQELRIKALVGSEEEVLSQFCAIAGKGFGYACGFNVIGYDLPIIIANSMKYFDATEVLPDKFNPSGKKPWNMDKIIDLYEVFKGTFFRHTSFDEACMHFGIPSPKDDINGADVSRVYYEEGVERIAKYVKKDVLASVQLFQRMRFEEIFTEFTDVDEQENTEVVIPELPPLEELYKNNEFSKEIGDRIKELKGKKKLTKKDKENLFTILRGVYVRTDFVNMDQDSKKVVQAKEEEIEEFIENGL
jgi:3'-5' exonuclease